MRIVRLWGSLRRKFYIRIFIAFEIRSYPSHELVLNEGKFFADEVTGPEGKLKSSEVTWKEGTADKRKYGFNYGVLEED